MPRKQAYQWEHTLTFGQRVLFFDLPLVTSEGFLFCTLYHLFSCLMVTPRCYLVLLIQTNLLNRNPDFYIWV